ncbi:hypothetical protein OG909_18460 [Streptomyces sp. NBC_01754]|uniref:hypothetical protein n=1 Tax=Streptomyces sp. NBC_01754 TaxID=2975930 RepID=UPI002DD853DE|nr:hypothetical protein [Streptomyces sp. NBC_01754]WSC94092.1 hypothetical protein OG909_18460 [Streptomyces sp. NBC_01754]
MAGARAALVALLMAGAVTACSPGPEQVLAVESLDGTSARLLTMTCEEFSPDGFDVYRSGLPDGEPLRMWAVSRDFTGPVVSSARVFQEPPGWNTYKSGISSFEPDGTYVASVDGGVHGKGVTGEVEFSAGQLKELAVGEVLTADGAGGTVTMGRDDFLEGANNRCDALAS